MSLMPKPAAISGTLRVLGAMLAYPDATMRSHLTEMRGILAFEDALPRQRLRALETLIERLSAADPLDAEAEYVQLFDCGRATSLHLFEHVHGDSRDRGPAMIDLAQTYEKAGLRLEPGELPDYLPALLEFASTQPLREARALLGEIAHILNSLHSALQHRGAPHAAIIGALLELAGETPTSVNVAPERPLDEAWAEPPAFGGCSSSGQTRPGAPQPVRIVRSNVQPGAVK